VLPGIFLKHKNTAKRISPRRQKQTVVISKTQQFIAL